MTTACRINHDTTTPDPHYTRNEITGERAEWPCRADAMQEARRMKSAKVARFVVCRPSGRIIAAWDNGKRSI